MGRRPRGKSVTTSTATNLNLVGTKLDGDWTITSQLPRPGTAGSTDLTGGAFSISCIASRKSSVATEKAFVKVIDVAEVLKGFPGNFMGAMRIVSQSYEAECAVLEACENAKLDRVVKVLGRGELPQIGTQPYPLPYIIFEHADGDLRKLVATSSAFEDAWKLRVLHDIAVGLQQLHQQKIAHQDLKPSNVLIFNDEGEGAKIGDFGRATLQGRAAPHDTLRIAGAKAYSPPELAYGITPTRWEDRRESCDLYHLGAIACFLISGRLPNSHFVDKIAQEILPIDWGGEGKSNYALALPFLTRELSVFVADISRDFPDWGRAELSEIVLNLCNPDYEKRGDPKSRSKVGSPLGIETFVSRFDRLARRALVKVRTPS